MIQWIQEKWKMLAAVGAIIGTVSGTATSAYHLWPSIRPYTPALMFWVHDSAIVRIIKIEIENNDNVQRRLVADLRAKEEEIKSDKAQSMPQYKQVLQIVIDGMKQELSERETRGKRLHMELDGQ